MAFSIEELRSNPDIEIGNIMPNPCWSLGFIHSYTFQRFRYCLDDLYDYNKYNNKCINTLASINMIGEDEIDKHPLNEHVWENLSVYIEESRQIVFDTYIENGVNECESYFLSLKFLWSTLKKTRNRLFKELDNREEYDRMPLKISINYLISRINRIMSNPDYTFSKEAASGKLSQFKKDATWVVYNHLVDEMGIIFYAKITM
jgi:hypothetical protein